MSKYEKLKNITDIGFKRLTGVQKTTFELMVELLLEHESKRKKLLGRPRKLSYEDQILMMLEYLREYRTYYHIALDYNISECNAYRMIKRAEDVLIKSKAFTLPAKKALDNMQIDVVLIDATETPIQRPKKSNHDTTLERKRDIR